MANRSLKWKSISKRNFIINALLFSNLFSFYYVFGFAIIPILNRVVIGNITVQPIFFFSIPLSVLLISQIYKEIGKKHIIASTSILALCLPLLFICQTFELSLIIIIIIGIAFGMSQLSSYVYFWRTTIATERGRIGGVLGLIAIPLYFLLMNFVSSIVGFLGNIIMCLGFCLFILIGASLIKENGFPKNKAEMAYYPEKRTIIFYSIPWILFCFLNATLSKNISIDIQNLIPLSFYAFLTISQSLGGLLGAVLGGFLADRGRRSTLILSVTLYGVSTTFKAFLSNDITFFLAFVAEGLSWGILLTLYSFVIWGDLANSKNVAKIYSIGLIGFYVSMGVGHLSSILLEIDILTSALISCLIIFLSYLPIILAPELLSTDIQEKNKIKKYMDTVKKIADKTDGQ